MRYKDDWEMAKKCHTAFWQQEIVDRCCVSVTAWDGADRTPLLVPPDDEGRTRYWADPETVIRRSRYRMEHTYYGGESYPAIFVNLGAGGHAGFFKGARHYFGESVWFFPSIEDIDSLEFDEKSYLYQKTLELARAFTQDSAGDYFVGMPDTTGNADALAHLMGTDELLPAMLEEPEAVQRALGKIQLSYEKIMREVYEITKGVNQGGAIVEWLSTWAPGFHAQMQSDMSVMISNPMFKEFVLPEIRAQSRFLEYPLYHFDGIEQIRHLDDLLSIPELKAIQWTQVAGQPPCTDYLPELKRIQAAGKSLIIITNPRQMETLLSELSSKGLMLYLWADSREEADAILKTAAKMTHD